MGPLNLVSFYLSSKALRTYFSREVELRHFGNKYCRICNSLYDDMPSRLFTRFLLWPWCKLSPGGLFQYVKHGSPSCVESYKSIILPQLDYCGSTVSRVI